MISLIFFLVASAGFVAAFLLMGTAKKRPTAGAGAPDGSAVSAVRHIIRPGGLSFANSKRLLDDAEYRLLLSNPGLQRVAKQLRSERQDLVLQWVSVLLCDLHSLWRFRRMLVRRGAPVRPGEELRALQTFVVCWALLIALKCSVRMAGPFAAPRLMRQAGGFVGSMSDAVASTLSRVPAAVWPEIERSWAAQAA